MQNKIYELTQKKETQNLIKSLTSKSSQLLRKIDKTNNDYTTLINEIKIQKVFLKQDKNHPKKGSSNKKIKQK